MTTETAIVLAVPDGPDPAVLLALAAQHADPRPYRVYLSTLGSDESRRAMQGCLDRIAGFAGLPSGALFPWHLLRYEHTSVIRAQITGHTWSPSHANKHLSALRGVLHQCWMLSLMSAEDYHRARSVKEVKGHREPAGRALGDDEVAKLLRSCAEDENTPLGLRDAALVAMLYSTGARRAEAAGALIERYDPRRRKLRIIGKGNKQRTVFILETAAFLLGNWLARMDERRGPILRPVDRWGTIAGRPLNPRSVGRIVAQRRTAAGLQPFTTHDFRRTFGGNFLEKGGDLSQLQKLFGHASMTVTAGYDPRPEETLRAAVDRLEMPIP